MREINAFFLTSPLRPPSQARNNRAGCAGILLLREPHCLVPRESLIQLSDFFFIIIYPFLLILFFFLIPGFQTQGEHPAVGHHRGPHHHAVGDARQRQHLRPKGGSRAAAVCIPVGTPSAPASSPPLRGCSVPEGIVALFFGDGGILPQVVAPPPPK